jgi:undecaprenyl-diphosphatase
MVDWFLGFVSVIGNWGYLIIFLVAFLESSAFLGMIVPGESIILIAGFLSLYGYLNIVSCMIVIGFGGILGDSTGYVLGRILGRGYFEKHGRLLFLKAKHIERVERYFYIHGGKTVFFGKFIGFLRSFGPFTAGMSRMPYRSFLIYNVTSCIIWATLFSLLGYFFGWSWQTIEKWSGRAGVFIFFILLIIIGFSRLYASIVKKQVELKAWFQEKSYHVANSPRLKRFVANPFVIFLKKRLSPEGYLGLHLTAGLAFSIICVWLFGELAEGMMAGDPIYTVDQWVLEHVLYFRTPSLSIIMILITQLGEWITITIASVLIAVFFILKKRRGSLIGYITTVVGGSILDYVLKQAIQRTRPISETTLISVGGFSFPSGHAMLSMVFYGMISYFLIRYIKQWRFRMLIVISVGFLIFLIGFSRIYLQVHYLSDVLAGYAGGLFWLTICVTGIEIYRKRKLSQS